MEFNLWTTDSESVSLTSLMMLTYNVSVVLSMASPSTTFIAVVCDRTLQVCT